LRPSSDQIMQKLIVGGWISEAVYSGIGWLRVATNVDPRLQFDDRNYNDGKFIGTVMAQVVVCSRGKGARILPL